VETPCINSGPIMLIHLSAFIVVIFIAAAGLCCNCIRWL
jgi:hypothetical protein